MLEEGEEERGKVIDIEGDRNIEKFIWEERHTALRSEHVKRERMKERSGNSILSVNDTNLLPILMVFFNSVSRSLFPSIINRNTRFFCVVLNFI